MRGGEGPSSTIQSLRSTKDVLWPKSGGEGEGDVEVDCRGVIGGEKGASSKGPLNCDFLGAELVNVDDDDDRGSALLKDSNVNILDWRAAEGMSSDLGDANCGINPECRTKCRTPSHSLSTISYKMPDLYAVAGITLCFFIPNTFSTINSDFCLVPIGTGDPSVAEHVAECQRILEKSGLKYKVHT